MNELISTWLSEQGINAQYIASLTIAVSLAVILLIASISYYLVKHPILGLIHRFVTHSKNKWDDAFMEHGVISRIAMIAPIVFTLFVVPFIFEASSVASTSLILVFKVLLTLQITRSISALLNVSRSIYEESAKQHFLPLNAIIEMVKLALYIVAAIIIISLIINRSPLFLFSGLGALTAVLLLVFQDTIKGFVASIQISANRMVVAGDWVQLPKYGADGDVLKIGLSTVKIENFDKTITTVPTYALISDSFKNWRNMYTTGARRIKRTVIIDLSSIDFYSVEKINQLTNAYLLQDYLTEKKQAIELNTKEKTEGDAVKPYVALNTRQLTNVGTFRAYITKYLQENKHIRNDLTCMVRQLPATESGLPLELYCFADTTVWTDYEAIQADIFDHLFAIAPQFDLRVFQHPTGYDWQKKSTG